MVTIRALRGFFTGGQAVKAGSCVMLDPLEAGEVVATGRAEYVDAEGKQETLAAVELARERAFPIRNERISFWAKR
jgi:hypothetical protein